MIASQSAKKNLINGRNSLSSTSALDDSPGENSDYSTPATSAIATPADQPKTSITRRGRRSTVMNTDVTTPAVNAVARAAALRNSQFSLNAASIKRKRGADFEDDEDEDNTADAQLARALQEQEDAQAAANAMTGMEVEEDDDELTSRRRTARKVQKILPKTDFASDFDDSEDDMPLAHKKASFLPPSKRPKIELSTSSSNVVKFTARAKSKVIKDSDDSDEFVEIDDSMEDSDAPIPMSTPRFRGKMVIKNSATSSSRDTKVRLKAPGPPPSVVPKLNLDLGKSRPALKREDTKASASSALTDLDSPLTEDEFDASDFYSDSMDSDPMSDEDLDVAQSSLPTGAPVRVRSATAARHRIAGLENRLNRRSRQERARLEAHHPELNTMWQDLENLPKIGTVKIQQPTNINRELKPFQLEGVAWMRAMEQTEWGGGLLGDEMGMGKTIQAVSLIMSDWPAKQPSLVLIPPVALMQWQQEIASYTDGTLKTFVYHGTNAQTKGVTLKDLLKYNVILMSYNSLESMYRKQEKGFKRKNGIHKEKSIIHQIQFHRVILDEAHNIKVRFSSQL